MTVMYLGGMILGNIDDHYRYENALSAFLRTRIAMFERDSNTFWGKHRSELIDLEKVSHFPDDAYYYLPEDPLVNMPFPEIRIVLLKRRFLNRLRQRLLKYKRQGRSVPHRSW